jgi:membrane protease subunit (stomatin/prohibitin family)
MMQERDGLVVVDSDTFRALASIAEGYALAYANRPEGHLTKVMDLAAGMFMTLGDHESAARCTRQGVQIAMKREQAEKAATQKAKRWW